MVSVVSAERSPVLLLSPFTELPAAYSFTRPDVDGAVRAKLKTTLVPENDLGAAWVSSSFCLNSPLPGSRYASAESTATFIPPNPPDDPGPPVSVKL
jgi:hypothetical protein